MQKGVVQMKKALILLITLTFITSMVGVLQAADLPKPVDKLAKGTAEVIKSPIELYDHTKKSVDSSDHKVIGLFKGLVMSPFHMAKKAGHGALDVATFVIE